MVITKKLIIDYFLNRLAMYEFLVKYEYYFTCYKTVFFDIKQYYIVVFLKMLL